MFSFIWKAGCLVGLLVLGALAWHFRAAWMPKARQLLTAEAPASTAAWAPITAAGRQRATERIEFLAQCGEPGNRISRSRQEQRLVMKTEQGRVAFRVP